MWMRRRNLSRYAALLPVLMAIPPGLAQLPSEPKEPNLHYELLRKHYDHALKAMPFTKDIDSLDERTGMTALCLAANDESADSFDMVHALVLKFGADVTVPDKRGLTPLHHAAQAGNLAVVHLLLTYGADINASVELPHVNITPLYLAYQGNHQRIAAFLELNGADEIEPTVRQDLEIQGAVMDAYRSIPKSSLEGLTQSEVIKRTTRRMALAASRKLREQNRPELVETWRRFTDIALEVMENMPPYTEKTSREEWVATVLGRSMSRLAETETNTTGTEVEQ